MDVKDVQKRVNILAMHLGVKKERIGRVIDSDMPEFDYDDTSYYVLSKTERESYELKKSEEESAFGSGRSVFYIIKIPPPAN